MTAESLLWVAVKALGLYLILQGILGTLSLLVAGATGRALLVQLGVPVVIGVYLLLGGGWIIRVAGGRP